MDWIPDYFRRGSRHWLTDGEFLFHMNSFLSTRTNTTDPANYRSAKYLEVATSSDSNGYDHVLPILLLSNIPQLRRCHLQ